MRDQFSHVKPYRGFWHQLLSFLVNCSCHRRRQYSVKKSSVLLVLSRAAMRDVKTNEKVSTKCQSTFARYNPKFDDLLKILSERRAFRPSTVLPHASAVRDPCTALGSARRLGVFNSKVFRHPLLVAGVSRPTRRAATAEWCRGCPVSPPGCGWCLRCRCLPPSGRRNVRTPVVAAHSPSLAAPSFRPHRA